MQMEGDLSELNGLSVSMSLDASHPSSVFSAPLIDPGLEQASLWVGGVRARFVRITREGSSPVNLVAGQVQVWALPSSSDVAPSRRVVDIMRVGPIKAGKNYCKKKLKKAVKKQQQQPQSGDVEMKSGGSSSSSSTSTSSGGGGGGGALVEGRLVVMLQDRMWRNGMMNRACDKRPHADGDYSHRLQYALLDWLKIKPEVTPKL
jgi:hypothetical protein